MLNDFIQGAIKTIEEGINERDWYLREILLESGIDIFRRAKYDMRRFGLETKKYDGQVSQLTGRINNVPLMERN